jgi:hypothetical protein
LKLPNVFFKKWSKNQCEPNLPKLGIDWFVRSGSDYSPWSGAGIYLIWWNGRIDIILADDGQAYADEYGRHEEQEWDFSLHKVTPKKPESRQ